MGQFTFRVPDDVHTKARVIAAFKNTSLNEFCVDALVATIKAWEKAHGQITIPEEVD